MQLLPLYTLLILSTPLQDQDYPLSTSSPQSPTFLVFNSFLQDRGQERVRALGRINNRLPRCTQICLSSVSNSS